MPSIETTRLGLKACPSDVLSSIKLVAEGFVRKFKATNERESIYLIAGMQVLVVVTGTRSHCAIRRTILSEGNIVRHARSAARRQLRISSEFLHTGNFLKVSSNSLESSTLLTSPRGNYTFTWIVSCGWIFVQGPIYLS